ncbi:MAG: hypothetical protein IPG08_14280 [Sphingobacteriaceae bacterium]|nr:hypothetical protein [Sphingobacteriaceae bacterium]
MDDIYNNQNYLSNNPLWHQEDSAFKAGLIHSILEENKIAYASVCEVGCGTGEILVQLKKLTDVKQFRIRVMIFLKMPLKWL